MHAKTASSQKSGTQTILWWVAWIVFTIASFFASAFFWTPVIAHYFGSVRESRAAIYWVVSVFGTWMVILVPLIIAMYAKVDKAYEDARLRREKNAARFRSILVEPSKRRLPEAVTQKISGWPQIIEGGHLVNVTLRDGRKIPNVYVAGTNEILGVYNAAEFSFEGKEVTDAELVDLKQAPSFSANLWLRLDGVKPQE